MANLVFNILKKDQLGISCQQNNSLKNAFVLKEHFRHQYWINWSSYPKKYIRANLNFSILKKNQLGISSKTALSKSILDSLGCLLLQDSFMFFNMGYHLVWCICPWKDFRANLINFILIILKINQLGISSKTAHYQLKFGFIVAK